LKKENLVAGLIFLVFSIFLYVETLRFPSPPVQGTGLAFWPRFLLIMLMCASLLLIYSGRRQEGNEAAEGAKRADKDIVIKKPLYAIAVSVLFMVLFKVTGFAFSIFLYFLAITVIVDPDLRPSRLCMRGVQALGVVMLVYVVFGLFLRVNLPKGIFF